MFVWFLRRSVTVLGGFLVGSRPTHEGSVTVKDGDKWRRIGDVAVWTNNPDGSVSGVIIIENVKSNFRAWKVS